jgi:choline dehydrogenase
LSSYGSPPILLRSGIGPADHLTKVGIPVRVDLPGVGANLADHAGVDIDCGFRQSSRATPVVHFVATFHSSVISSNEAPDLMLWLSDQRGPTDGQVFEIDVGLLRPCSRGSRCLRSADPADPPSIELPGLRDPIDVERLAEAYLRGLDVAERPNVRRLCADQPSPQTRDSNDLRNTIRMNSYSFPHVTGTCSMGSRPEDGGVVDVSGRVHGRSGSASSMRRSCPTGPLRSRTCPR